MQQWTKNRDEQTPDSLWLLQHPPTYTLGQAADPQHIHHAGTIPVVQTDRGGQVTYHGPGQLMIYCLINLKQRPYSVHGLIERLEQSIVAYLASLQLIGETQKTARGVYIDQKKIAAVGLRIKQGCSYHGLAFNVDMDLDAFNHINPCGYPTLQVSDLRTHAPAQSMDKVQKALIPILNEQLGPYRLCHHNSNHTFLKTLQ